MGDIDADGTVTEMQDDGCLPVVGGIEDSGVMPRENACPNLVGKGEGGNAKECMDLHARPP
ncbi:hypothetical protein [Mesobacillus foraminis]|uniref:hypothetical protein n=1 Tax=Mesobacillus foraminis TaxID=279826 RepID=UPI000EF46167|nr:hypothetical protein [Mesobacillus foraminis]